MKLRMKGNSLRLRVSRSELARLQAGGRIEENVFFPTNPSTSLSYTLEADAHNQPVHATFVSQRISVSVSKAQLASWSGEDQVGIYASLPINETTNLDIVIEKDFACLDLSDAENEDTFANPMAGSAC